MDRPSDSQPVQGLRCACGWQTTGTVDQLVTQAEEHGRRNHNMAPTREQVMEMLVPIAELEERPATD